MKTARQIPISAIVIVLVVFVAVGVGLMSKFGRQLTSANLYEASTEEHAVDDERAVSDEDATQNATEDGRSHDGSIAEASKKVGVAGTGDGGEELDASGQIGEERYIRLCVDMVIAAIGFQNSGQGHEELAAYLPELLKNEGVTMAAFEEATDVISDNPRQAERVAEQIVKRVEQRIGTKMDMRVLPMLNPSGISEREQER